MVLRVGEDTIVQSSILHLHDLWPILLGLRQMHGLDLFAGS